MAKKTVAQFNWNIGAETIDIRTELISPFSARTENLKLNLEPKLEINFHGRTETTNRNIMTTEIRIWTEIIFYLRTEIELK